MSGSSVITPTGDRPEAFGLCCEYMKRQTTKPTEWIIVDDGKIPTTPPNFDFVKYYRREKANNEPEHTLPIQLLHILDEVNTDRVIIMEDDDWYHPQYLEKMNALFSESEDYDLVGFGDAVYYHIPLKKYYYHNNKNRASWCQTGFRRSFSSEIARICEKHEPFIDLYAWKSKCKKNLKLEKHQCCIGIKGLPGREGTTMGWRRTHLFLPDSDLHVLKKLIGNEDIKKYKKYFD